MKEKETDLVLAEFAGHSNYGDAKHLLEKSPDVYLRHNDENGDWMWSVESVLNREFWFNAFLTRVDAAAWCEKVGLKVIGVENMKEG